MEVLKIGLESHISIAGLGKLFCLCEEFQHCPICKSIPGYLPQNPDPVLYEKVTDLALLLGSSLSSSLTFYRKHYDYYDLPAGFQRTQHPEFPYAKGGSLKLYKTHKQVLIRALYLEEDPASTVGVGIDFSRAGSPLIELVTEPCFIGTYDQVKPQITEYLQTLSRLCLDLGIVDKSKVLKSDVNVSLEGSSFRYELKNITSTQDILSAIRLAIPLLVRDKDHKNKTYHFKNKLIFSRYKTSYPYLKDYNLKPITLDSKRSNLKLTLYELVDKFLETSSYRDSYLYAKELLKKDLVKKPWIDLLPKDGLRKLKLDEKETSALRPYLTEYWSKNKISKESYAQKDLCFKQFVNELKKNLLNSKISFSSQLINKILGDLLSL